MAKKTAPPAPGKATGRGGPRPNSGRPRVALTKSRDELDAQITKLVGPKLKQLVEALLAQALGHLEERQIDGETAVVFTVPPDFKVGAYLLDRIAGKPRQSLSVEGSALDIRAAAEMTAAAAAAYRDPEEDGDGPDDDAGA